MLAFHCHAHKTKLTRHVIKKSVIFEEKEKILWPQFYAQLNIKIYWHSSTNEIESTAVGLWKAMERSRCNLI